jgi:hypothetical protein
LTELGFICAHFRPKRFHQIDSRNVKIVPDCSLKEALDGGKANFDVVVLPGEL